MSTTNLNRKTSRRRGPRFELMAGSVVCLDFINTLDDRFSGEPKELLKTYPDLLHFAEDSGILDQAQVDRLLARSQMSAEETQRVLAAAIEMREAMFAVFVAIARRKHVPPAALATLNQYIQAAVQRAQLVAPPRSESAQAKTAASNARFEWRFQATAGSLDDPMWPIARSAADLLTSDQLVHVHMCASKTCEWFFLDTSKNHRRRWCDMSKCGNRAKVQRFYQRNKKNK